MNAGGRVLALAATLAVSAATGEAALRLVDGYRLTALRLVPVDKPLEGRPALLTEWPTAGADAIAAPHLESVPRPPGVDAAWFFTDPPIPSVKQPRPDLEALSRAAGDPTLAKFARRIWNLNFVIGQAKRRESYWAYLKQIRTPLHVFDPPDHSEYPRYRMIPDDPHAEAWPTGTMASNNLGYRGRDVARVKSSNTFRVVFVGASTTIDHPSFPRSFTDYVGHYLNRWGAARGLEVTFEVINTAREGLTSTDIAAVVEQEVVRLSPDIVVYKEGANQFGEAKKLLAVSDSPVKPIAPEFLETGVIDGAPGRYRSDARRRWDVAASRLRPLDEAPRPPYVVHWPAGLSEDQPDISRADLPLDLPTILGDLRRIQSMLQPQHADLAVSSFVWMVDDHLRLIPGRANERAIYWYLNGNENVWPLSYHDIRRFADLQNRVLLAFARESGAYFVDLARWFPRVPALFIDGIHLTYPGIKVHGWITFLQLLPLVEQRLADHTVSRPAPDGNEVAYSTIALGDIEQKLAEGASPLPLPDLSGWKAGTPAVRLTRAGPRLTVEGTATRWAYQLVSPGIPVEPGVYYRVALPTTVTSGVIGVGVLDQSGNTWISSPLDAKPFTFFSGPNRKVQLVVADATPTLGTVKPSLFEVRQAR